MFMPISRMYGIELFLRESEDTADKFVSLHLFYNLFLVIGDLVIEPEKSNVIEEVPNADDLLIEQADGEIEEIDMPEELDD